MIRQLDRRARGKRALVLLLPGLGDALAASPIVRWLQKDPDYTIDALTMLKPVAEYATALGAFTHVFNLPLLTSPASALPALLKLRNMRYDLVALPFPATRWQYALVTRAIGGRRTLSHDYGGIHRNILTTLARATLVPLEGGHRIAENARLTDAPEPNRSLSYMIPNAWRGTEKGYLGLHTGSMVYKGNEVRRWPLDKFRAVIERQISLGRHVRLFVGPHEREDGEAISHHFKGEIEIVSKDLAAAAYALSECSVFVGNDAGLSHLSAALGVKTICLFGMTNPTRATPIGRTIVLRPSPCMPCHDEGSLTFSCTRRLDYRCLKADLTVKDVLQAIEFAYANSVPAYNPSLSGPYSLYGVQHNSRSAS